MLSTSLRRQSSLVGPRVRLAHAGRRRRVYAPSEMGQLLERERDRSDRTGMPFALLVFCAHEPRSRRDLLAAIAKVLAGRLRISDELGQLDRARLAAVLPATSAAGAWTVLDDVCLKLPADLPLPKCDVYMYPSETTGNTPAAEPAVTGSIATNDAPGKGRGGNRANGNSERHARVLAEEERRIEPNHCQRADTRPVRPLEPLLIRPLPWWKRMVDISFASLALMALSPVFLVVSLAVKLTSPGPVLFRQMRSGLGGRPFVFYKFRSMVPDAEAKKADLMALNEQDGPAFKLRRDPRVTWIGRLLRKTSLDELPQLWNVLRGDMSLVGPRPLPCAESEACTGWHRRRIDVTPGLTCIWQVEGRSRVSFDDWVRMDIRYMRLRSLVNDSLLIVRTLPAMLMRRGV